MHRAHLKYHAKHVLDRVGLRVSRGGPPRTDLRGFVQHVVRLGFEPATVIDVGVADGTFELYGAFPRARHLLVEPMAEFEDALRYIRDRYGAEYVLALASEEAGEIAVRVDTDLHGVSLLNPVEPDYERTLPVVRLDDLVTERSLQGPYFVKVDVQGAELQVLRGAPGILEAAEVVVLETALFRFKEGAPDFADVFDFMRERGFAVYDVFGGHTRPLDGALAQFDVAFVRENGRFRSSHAFDVEGAWDEQQRSLRWKVRRLLRV